ncbi:type II toxin-antitoxin system RelE/ParE family toxin [Winslowiella toletana]
MRLKWSAQSVADRSAIMDYIAKDNPGAAAELDDRFEAAADLACQYPEIHKQAELAAQEKSLFIRIILWFIESI